MVAFQDFTIKLPTRLDISGISASVLRAVTAQKIDKLTQICYTYRVKIDDILDQFLIQFFANLRANLLEILK